MSDLSKEFILSFLALLIAMDPVGNVPFYVSLTDGMDPPRKRLVLIESLMTALIVGMLFLLVGRGICSVLGVTLSDFKIAGGLLLVVVAVADMLVGKLPRRKGSDESVGAVPIGVPLICGPAVITLLMVQARELTLLTVGVTAAAYLANLVIIGAAFAKSQWMTRLLGRSGTRAFSRVVMVILCAFGVMLIRAGVTEAIAAGVAP